MPYSILEKSIFFLLCVEIIPRSLPFSMFFRRTIFSLSLSPYCLSISLYSFLVIVFTVYRALFQDEIECCLFFSLPHLKFHYLQASTFP